MQAVLSVGYSAKTKLSSEDWRYIRRKPTKTDQSEEPEEPRDVVGWQTEVGEEPES